MLTALSKKKSRLIVGLMSGTSLDGLDIALCRFSGSGLRTKFVVEQFQSIPYSDQFKADVRRVFAQEQIDFQWLTLLHTRVAEVHATLVLQCLQTWNYAIADVDLIASHGQTVYHAPKSWHGMPDFGNATFQIGDGDHLAVRTGIVTVSDFRQKHVAAGGEGAPLSLYGDYYLFSKRNEDRFLLNIGGISNFTFLPADADSSKVMATDTGPGNTLMDYWARKEFGQAYDKDGIIASSGIVQQTLLDRLLGHPFLASVVPKTTGPEMFSTKFLDEVLSSLPKGQLNPFDIMATLAAFTARSIALHIRQIPSKSKKKRVFVSGGGAHNPVLMALLQTELLDFEVIRIESIGINGDAKEALLFATLANEMVYGKRSDDQILGGVPLVKMGKISLPY
jgi:anhydro-N-acetylmuramic acid kinase